MAEKTHIERLFHAACELDSDQRDAFLDAACGENSDVRREVESMLRHDEADSGFMAGPAVSPPAVTQTAAHVTERPGAEIGPYRLMEQIGEGGFGLVFVAQQQKPVRRKVALKIIKPGMDTRDVVARFEAERQALALMDHPNIAKVLDAGTTPSGRPFFVMELIRGIPIVEYCDSEELTTQQRLELFVSVCRAVQHAHSKGVIHRDLKPSNILVSPHDGIPVVKIIDFGIAKAIGGQLTDKTIYTRLTQMIGTPLYMSPEQAEVNALDVDTRSDVYSLGVLLYELLTGTTPFDSDRFSQAAYEEIKRIIREEEPPSPSRRLSSLGATLPTISKQRKTEPAKLTAALRGELDWIVMCCLEKERTRRYQTAAELAADVERYLTDEPVQVVPPSRIYRAKKVVRRNRIPIAVGIGYIVLSTIALAAFFRQTQVANRYAENLANVVESQGVLLTRYRERLTHEALLYAFSGDLERVDQIVIELDDLDRGTMTESPMLEADFLRAVAHFYRGEIAVAKESLNKVLVADQENISAMGMLALAGGYDGTFDDCLKLNAEIDRLLASRRATNFELLFAGHGTMPVDVPKSIERLSELVARRPSWAIARSALADALAHHGNGFDSVEMVDEALGHIRDAKSLAPNIPLIDMLDLWVHTTAINVYNRNDIAADSLIAHGRQVAISVDEYEDYGIAQTVRFWFSKVCGSEAEQTQAARRVLEAGDYLWTASAHMYGSGYSDYVDEKLRELAAHSKYATLLRIRGDLLTSEDLSKQTAELNDWMNRDQQNVEALLDLCQLLLVMGDSRRAKEIALSIKDKWGNELPQGGFFAYAKQVEVILADYDTADQYLSLISTEENPYRRAVMAWQAGSVVLGRGDRDGALRLYRITSESSFFNTGYKAWTELYVRLLSDPESTWPHWQET